MTIAEFEEIHQVNLRPRLDSFLLAALDLIFPSFADKWTVMRFPFEKRATIYYSADTPEPTMYRLRLEHELVHCRQFAPWYAPILIGLLAVLLPLPFGYSGRWFIERWAFLRDIRNGRHTIDSAVNTLWACYGWPWPRERMRAWFNNQLDIRA